MKTGRVTLTHQWSDGSALCITIQAAGHPDGLDDARAVAVRALADTLDVIARDEFAADDTDD